MTTSGPRREKEAANELGIARWILSELLRRGEERIEQATRGGIIASNMPEAECQTRKERMDKRLKFLPEPRRDRSNDQDVGVVIGTAGIGVGLGVKLGIVGLGDATGSFINRDGPNPSFVGQPAVSARPLDAYFFLAGGGVTGFFWPLAFFALCCAFFFWVFFGFVSPIILYQS